MKTNCLVVSCLVVCAWVGTVSASTITFLNDYETTNDLADVVHLGDQTLTEFVRDTAQASSWTWNFDLTEPVGGPKLVVHLDHYQCNQEIGYYDYIYVNDVSIGMLDASDEHWYSQDLTGNASLLQPTGNTLKIVAYRKGGNYDDFEFTNVTMRFVPEPATLLVLSLGELAAGRKRRRAKSDR